MVIVAVTSRNNKNEHDEANKLLCSLVSHYHGSSAKILIGKNGRPYIENGTFDISLSHSKDAVAVAITVSSHFPDYSADGVILFKLDIDAKAVGIDIECKSERNERRCLSVAQGFFGEAEFSKIRNSQDKVATFLKFWTKKEAALKLTGEGIAGLRGLADNMPRDIMLTEKQINISGDTYFLSLATKS